MEFKTTFTKARKRAFTLVELMIGTGIATMAMGILAVTTSMMLTSFDSMSNYIELEQQSRYALDKMSREIRSAEYLDTEASNGLLFKTDTSYVYYIYSTSDRKLYRYHFAEARLETLLENVDRLDFSIFQRNPIGGSYDQHAAASETTCKLVQLNWTCSLENFVGTQNTELVQSAKFVIRKQ
jgi:hypothetical protein